MPGFMSPPMAGGNGPRYMKSNTIAQDYWSQEQLDLSDYMNSSQVVIRFRIEDTYTYGSNDGWYIDDVMITEQGIGPVNKIVISPDAASVLEGNSLI